MTGRPPLHDAPFDAFVAPARAAPQVWRLIVGILLVEMTFLATGILLVGILPPDPLNPVLIDIGMTPATVIVILASFAPFLAATVFVATRLHHRSGWSLVGARSLSLAWPAAAITLAIMIASERLVFDSGLLIRATSAATFLAWLPLALPALALQTGAEEIFYRGYLQTQLAARYASPIVWMGVPSFLFAQAHVDLFHLWTTGHFANNDGIWFVVIGLGGLFAADLTRVSGGIGAAWGWHFANNLHAMFLVSMNTEMSGLALWLLPYGPDDPVFDTIMVGQLVALQVIIWAAIRLWIARTIPVR
ncbi:MAG: CPBP family intramembrane glutamic endopeptidase [Jannaschia sp.]